MCASCRYCSCCFLPKVFGLFCEVAASFQMLTRFRFLLSFAFSIFVDDIVIVKWHLFVSSSDSYTFILCVFIRISLFCACQGPLCACLFVYRYFVRVYSYSFILCVCIRIPLFCACVFVYLYFVRVYSYTFILCVFIRISLFCACLLRLCNVYGP